MRRITPAARVAHGGQASSRAPVARESAPVSLPVILFVGVLAATVLAIGGALRELSDPSTLPIKKVLVEGEFTHLDPGRLQQVVVNAVDGGFFHVNVAEIRRQLLDEPWIRDATIRRVWPATLHVRVVEQAPVAQWGTHALLNDAGDLFAPAAAQIPPGLVRLEGPLGTELQVLRRYRAIDETLAPAGIRVRAVEVSSRQAWTVTTTDGHVLVLGRDDVAGRLQRLLFALRNGMAEHWEKISSVDLRYTNGFAVSTKPATEEQG